MKFRFSMFDLRIVPDPTQGIENRNSKIEKTQAAFGAASVRRKGMPSRRSSSRLLAVALPTIRDFRGVGVRLDGRGNYNLGIQDFTIFPEITVENVKKTMGLDITIVTSAETDDEARELLKLLGMPFRRVEQTTAPKATAA